MQLNEPCGLAWSADGLQLYFTDSQHHVVRMYDPALGSVVTIAGRGGVPGYSGDGGNALSALFYLPTGLSLGGSNDTLWVADTYNRVVRQLSECAFKG